MGGVAFIRRATSWRPQPPHGPFHVTRPAIAWRSSGVFHPQCAHCAATFNPLGAVTGTILEVGGGLRELSDARIDRCGSIIFDLLRGLKRPTQGAW